LAGWAAHSFWLRIVWDADKGTELRTLQRNGGVAISVAFSPDGKRIVAACGLELKVWDVDKGTEIPASEQRPSPA
jgi:WD40 repeat protein